MKYTIKWHVLLLATRPNYKWRNRFTQPEAIDSAGIYALFNTCTHSQYKQYRVDHSVHCILSFIALHRPHSSFKTSGCPNYWYVENGLLLIIKLMFISGIGVVERSIFHSIDIASERLKWRLCIFKWIRYKHNVFGCYNILCVSSKHYLWLWLSQILN